MCRNTILQYFIFEYSSLHRNYSLSAKLPPPHINAIIWSKLMFYSNNKYNERCWFYIPFNRFDLYWYQKAYMDFFVNSTILKSGTPILQLFTLPTIIRQSRVHFNFWTYGHQFHNRYKINRPFFINWSML